MRLFRIAAALVFLTAASLQIAHSQARVGFVSSDIIRDKFIEANQAEQRIQSIVEEWKRELAAMQKNIENLEFEISKNRLIWSDEERVAKERELEQLKERRLQFARAKFEPNGEYDVTVKMIKQPVEEKIYAAIQEVSADKGYDLIWDQSVQPLAYVNFKYDITVSVLRKLGVDVAELEKELQKKISNDPRNQKRQPKTGSRRSRSRRVRTEKPDTENIENPASEGDENFDENPPDENSPENEEENENENEEEIKRKPPENPREIRREIKPPKTY